MKMEHPPPMPLCMLFQLAYFFLLLSRTYPRMLKAITRLAGCHTVVILFRQRSNPMEDMSGAGLTNAKFRVLIPSNTQVLMTVSKTGYQDWSFTRNGTAAPIILGPGETQNLDIKLKQSSAHG
jgi:hypothetical protein